MTAVLDPVLYELDRWVEQGRAARLWLRDDDATEATPALRDYLAMAADFGVAPLIAAIPSRLDRSLGDVLAPFVDLRVAVHGWSHANRAGDGEKKSEYPESRPLDAIERDLSAGLSRIRSEFAGQAIAVLVPPWNRISAVALGRLVALGYAGASTYAAQHTGAQPPSLVLRNTHVDLIDWTGGRCGKPMAQVARELAAALAKARSHGEVYVGLLSHHLDHDETASASLRMVLELAGRAPGLSLATPQEVFFAS